MPRKVDQFAGKDSMSDRLRRRREAIESGDPSGGDSFKNDAPIKVASVDDNRPSNVLKRGFYVEKDE